MKDKPPHIDITRVDAQGNIDLEGVSDDNIRSFFGPIIEGFIDVRKKGGNCTIRMIRLSQGDRYACTEYIIAVTVGNHFL